MVQHLSADRLSNYLFWVFSKEIILGLDWFIVVLGRELIAENGMFLIYIAMICFFMDFVQGIVPFYCKNLDLWKM